MSSTIKVAKFGGSSLASCPNIDKVYELIASDHSRKIIVVSAPGKRNAEDSKVTDLLIECGEACLKDKDVCSYVNRIVQRYREIADGLGLNLEIIDNIKNDISQRLSAKKTDIRLFMDGLKAAGEDNCAKLIECYLKYKGLSAQYISPKDAGLVLSEEYGNVRVLPEAFERLKKLRNQDTIIVFPGFFGYSLDGEIITFSRGGSDVTGAILAAAVQADVYENFTDVDCVSCANPNIVPNALPITKLTYREMRELSYSGFSILHEEALEPVYRAGIPVWIKNTNNPSARGTWIVNSCENKSAHITGIASQPGFCGIHVIKYMMNREIGFVRKILSILEILEIPYEHIPSGIDAISIILSESYLTKDVEDKLVSSIKKELCVDQLEIEKNFSLITIVGESMISSEVAARATNALAKASVKVEMISQGPCRISMTFAVKELDEARAVKAVYYEFFEK